MIMHLLTIRSRRALALAALAAALLAALVQPMPVQAAMMAF
jgi:hypothetical protein